MKNREDKKKDYQELREALEKVNNLFVAGFEKMTVSQDFELRKTVRGVGGTYRVVKNNIAELASAGLPSEEVLKGLKGMTSVVYTPGDPVALAKALTVYGKTNPSFTFKAGMVEGRAIDVKAITELANLPAKEVIYSKLLWLINSPAQRMVTVVNGVGRNLAVVIDQGVQENKFQQ